jgi:RHS repeat-associated protein
MNPGSHNGAVYWFKFTNPGYAVCFCHDVTLTGGNGQDWKLKEANNVVTAFSSSGAALGQAKTAEDQSELALYQIAPNGDRTDFLRADSSMPHLDETALVEILRTFVRNGTTLYESQLIEYYDSGTSLGLLQRITVRQKTEFDSEWRILNKTEYEYYEDDIPDRGTTGDLKFVHQVSRENGVWSAPRTTHYRYHTAGSDHGDAGMIKFLIEQDNFQRLIATLDPVDVDDVSDSNLMPYSQVYYEYNEEGMVSGVGTLGGIIYKTVEYTLNPNPNYWDDIYNYWKRKAVLTRAYDGATVTVFSNALGQDILKHESDDTGDHITAWQFDERGRKIITYTPTSFDPAQQPYNESALDLDLNIRDDQGLIELTNWYDETDPLTGAAANRIESTQVQKGRFGTPITLTRTEYVEHTATIEEIELAAFRVSKQITYQSETGTGNPVASEYQYTLHEDSIQLETKTTILPDVPASENGIGWPQSDTTVETYELSGRLLGSTDARGVTTQYEYDLFYGTVVRTVEDVGGLERTTESQFDELGRQIISLGPVHELDGQPIQTVQWTVYKSQFETWTAQGYQTVVEESDSETEPVVTLVNPVSIQRRASDGSIVDSITAVRGSTVESNGALSASDSFPQSSWTGWSRTYYDVAGRQTSQRVYHDIPSSGEGTLGTNYLETTFGYDSLSRQNRILTPDGTISRTVFNGRDQATSSWVGTDDTGATDEHPPGEGGNGNNMVQLTITDYGVGGSEGNGQVTSVQTHINDNYLDIRITSYDYDWRNRRIRTYAGGTYRDEVTLDNLGRVLISERFRAEGLDSILLSRSQSFYDTRGRQYRTRTWAVSDAGVAGNYLESNQWFDADGQVIKSTSPGSQIISKMVYDNLGRVTNAYSALYTGGGTDDPTSVSGNVVLTEHQTTYNEAGLALMSVSKDRWHDATGNGALNGPSGSNPKSRDSYVAFWYDGIGRSIATANYGTNNNAGVPSRPASVPTSSDTVPVTQTRYDIRGQVFETVDPVGSVRRTEFDDAGRVTRTIENYGGTDTQTVRIEYNSAGQMSKQIAENVETGDQETVYTYGVTMPNSELATNQLLQSITWPDGGITSYQYNRAGGQISVTDPNETVHEYLYDEFGRRTANVVTTLGSGVDGSVRRIEYSFNDQERIEKITCFDAVTAGNVQSEILYQYNDFGQITREYQQHGDEVDLMTTPFVEYNYADGSANTIRLVSMTYPDGRQIDYGYGTSGSTTDRTGRVATIKIGSTTLATYTYLGSGQLVSKYYNQPEILRTIVTGSGSNPYASLDRFGRLIDLRWTDVTNRPGVDVVQFEYGYDRVSNRLFERNLIPTGTNPDVDSLFGFDELNRLTQFEMGELNGGGTAISSPELTQDWVLDETGNFVEFNQGVVNALEQTRTHNEVNEIIGIDETVGASWATPAHDDAGNMTAIPQPINLTSSFTAVWDAWDRLVSISSGGDLVAKYEYDGVNRRILVTSYDFTTDPETIEVCHRYYTLQSQVIEERIDSSDDAAQQYVWNVGYIDDLILRDRDTNGNGTLDERLYALTDLRYSIMALANTSGTIVERFQYEPHGRSVVLDASFAPRTPGANGDGALYVWEYRYTGRELDLPTGLHYFRARYYHPDLGRFVSRDPIGYVDGMSLYSAFFVIETMDPFGMETWNECCPELLECVLSIFRKVADSAIAVDANQQRLEELLAMLSLVRRAYSQANQDNANSSIWSLLWGNGKGAQPISAAAIAALGVRKLSRLQGGVSKTVPGLKGFQKLSAGQQLALKTLARVGVYSVIADWAINIGLDLLVVKQAAETLVVLNNFEISMQGLEKSQNAKLTIVKSMWVEYERWHSFLDGREAPGGDLGKSQCT